MFTETALFHKPSFLRWIGGFKKIISLVCGSCLLYTSDAAHEEDSVELGGRRIIKKK